MADTTTPKINTTPDSDPVEIMPTLQNATIIVPTPLYTKGTYQSAKILVSKGIPVIGVPFLC
ncbi:hypothetical protein EFP07_14900 [Lactiplantibacillus plantarum]|nr:hypothetical protein [Lactiplantibacillus plantarum]